MMPIGPAPKTTTNWPAATRLLRIACCATQAGSVMAIASIGAVSEVMRCQAEGMRQYSAKPPSRREPR